MRVLVKPSRSVAVTFNSMRPGWVGTSFRRPAASKSQAARHLPLPHFHRHLGDTAPVPVGKPGRCDHGLTGNGRGAGGGGYEVLGRWRRCPLRRTAGYEEPPSPEFLPSDTRATTVVCIWPEPGVQVKTPGLGVVNGAFRLELVKLTVRGLGLGASPSRSPCDAWRSWRRYHPSGWTGVSPMTTDVVGGGVVGAVHVETGTATGLGGGGGAVANTSEGEG